MQFWVYLIELGVRRIQEELLRTGVDDGWAILLQFAPDMLRNISATANDKSHWSRSPAEGLLIGLRVLVSAVRSACSMTSAVTPGAVTA